MIIGIFLTIILLYLFPLIFRWVGLDNYEKYTAKNIFNKAWAILRNIGSLKDVLKESQEYNKYNWQLNYPTNTNLKVNDAYTL